MTCSDLHTLLDRSADSLTNSEWLSAMIHVHSCSGCYAELLAMFNTLDAASQVE